MSSDSAAPDSEMNELDPSNPRSGADSAAAERPPRRRRIDCAGNPEISDRQRAAARSGRDGSLPPTR